MGKRPLAEIVSRCNELLQPELFDDWPGAVNGLQVENRGGVSRIAAAVDATLSTVRLASAAGADLLVVHHGLFWSPAHPWTGRKYELLQVLLESDIAVYSSHLPLDAHPRLGNNAQLCAALGLTETQPFFFERGRHLGLQANARMSRQELLDRLRVALGVAPHLIPGGPDPVERIGVVTGGAGEQVRIAKAEGVDTFITGEGAHWTFALAEELGINLIYGGHYATETFGVVALARELSAHFGLPWTFIDYPTGL